MSPETPLAKSRETPLANEESPEITEFLAEEKRRRDRGLFVLFGISLATFAAGLGLFVWAFLKQEDAFFSLSGGGLLMAGSVLAIIRLALSRFTALDERPLPYGEEAAKLEKKLLGE